MHVHALLCSLDETQVSESDQEAIETGRADKSLFVQELLLAALSDHAESCDVSAESAVEETALKVAAAAPQTTSSSHVASVEPSRAAASVNVDRAPAAAAAAAVSRTNRMPAAGSVPPMDGNRIVPNQSSRSAIVKRKPIPATTRTGKESTPAAATSNKRH